MTEMFGIQVSRGDNSDNAKIKVTNPKTRCVKNPALYAITSKIRENSLICARDIHAINPVRFRYPSKPQRHRMISGLNNMTKTDNINA